MQLWCWMRLLISGSWLIFKCLIAPLFTLLSVTLGIRLVSGSGRRSDSPAHWISGCQGHMRGSISPLPSHQLYSLHTQIHCVVSVRSTEFDCDRPPSQRHYWPGGELLIGPDRTNYIQWQIETWSCPWGGGSTKSERETEAKKSAGLQVKQSETWARHRHISIHVSWEKTIERMKHQHFV